MECPPSEGDNNEEEPNPYLALRAAKIARNQERLRALGLLKNPFQTSTGRRSKEPSAAAAAAAAARRKRNAASRASRRHPAASDLTYGRELRRSKRLIVPKESSLAVEEEVAALAGDSTSSVVPPSPTQQHPRRRKIQQRSRDRAAATAATATFPSNSARAIHLDIDLLMERVLGRYMARTGKAWVMEESARIAAAATAGTSLAPTAGISFNKYSGVQEWASGSAMFLWVNLGAPNTDVVNDFTDGGRQVTWFGGARMHEESPVIRKLVGAGEGEGTSSGGTASVVLWCREYNPNKKTFSPYVCLGRLSLVSYNPNTRPLEFTWQLNDYDFLIEHPELSIRRNFHHLVKEYCTDARDLLNEKETSSTAVKL